MEGLKLPAVVFGTSGLGNLFTASSYEAKYAIVKECVTQSGGKVVFDTAGKYGAGLSLETLGKCLSELQVRPEDVIISNKLGWLRTELKTPEPAFEPGVWKDLKYDAIQKISYNGIIECFEQGNELLNGYVPRLVSVHDPDEYIAAAADEKQAGKHYEDILEAYRALFDLKEQGKVMSVGVGAKDWKIIQRIAADVPLDWVMIANSLTIKNHPPELLKFVEELRSKNVYIINSAVFHSGFLIGSDYYDYKLIQSADPVYKDLFKWRNDFFKLCKEFEIKPAEACVQFALNVRGVKSIALNTTNAKRVKENIDLASVHIPESFWKEMKNLGLLEKDYPYL